MPPKITLEQFRQIKDKILTFYNETKGDKGTLVLENLPTFAPLTPQQLENINNRRRTLRDLGVSKENYDYWWHSTHSNYLKELLSYDLSDIPYEEWVGIRLVTYANQILDLSPTRANIDFNLVSYEGFCNFNGCNVRNIECLGLKVKPGEFDQTTQDSNQTVFLPSMFDEEFKTKYYQAQLTIEDLVALNTEQLAQIKQMTGITERFQKKDIDTIKTLGVERARQLYEQSTRDFNVVSEIIFIAKHKAKEYFIEYDGEEGLAEKLKTTPPNEIKNVCYEVLRTTLLNGNLSFEAITNLPMTFKDENQEVLLIGDNVPEKLRTDYYNKNLSFEDAIDNIELFNGIPIEKFLSDSTAQNIENIIKRLGRKYFYEQIAEYKEFFKYLVEKNQIWYLDYVLNDTGNPETNFLEAVKKIVLYDNSSLVSKNEQGSYEMPPFLTPFNFRILEKISSYEDLPKVEEYSRTLIMDKEQRAILSHFGIANIIQLEQETTLFFHELGSDDNRTNMFNLITNFISHEMPSLSSLPKFKNGMLSYDEFSSALANLLNEMRYAGNLYQPYTEEKRDYRWLEGPFREQHSKLFISNDAPEGLIDAFYRGPIPIETLVEHKEYIPWLINADLPLTIKYNIAIGIQENQQEDPEIEDLIDFLAKNYGNEKTLALISKYGVYFTDNVALIPSCTPMELNSFDIIEKKIRDEIYKFICGDNKYSEAKPINYSFLEEIKEFKEEHPELFVDFSQLDNVSQEELEKLRNRFYSGLLDYGDIKKYPKLKDLLKDKNLTVAFGKTDNKSRKGRIIKRDGSYSDMELLMVFGQDKFLELCSKYGRYLEKMGSLLASTLTIKNNSYINPNQSLDIIMSFEEVCQVIETKIYERCQNKEFKYHSDDAPEFLLNQHPELFLPMETPQPLKDAYYNHQMTFLVLGQVKNWQDFITKEEMYTALLRIKGKKLQKRKKYFEVFGIEVGLKLGTRDPETITKIIDEDKIDLAKEWYDKTGGKYLPNYVIIENFPETEMDKFLTSSTKWKKLMQTKRYIESSDTKADVLKLAYSLGLFDNDPKALSSTITLLNGLPMKFDSSLETTFNKISEQIQINSRQNYYFNVASEDQSSKKEIEPQDETAYNAMLEYLSTTKIEGEIDNVTLEKLFKALKEETNIDFRSDVFSQIYKKNKDGTYELAIAPQKCPKSAGIIRLILEKFEDVPILNPEKVHKIFGGFDLKYNQEFNSFFLDNLYKILKNSDLYIFVSRIQRRFEEIKALSSNIAMSFEAIIDYISNNKYEDVDVGNERVAPIASLAKYSQENFEKLQQLYNYGKQRIFSSIPRIENATQKYTYEMLRLDDPLALAIGTLTDCCQELGNHAEACMAHSVVDKNGRVFVIRDKEGKICAQSWVWRNKDVLCFDNIEIPDRAFKRAKALGLSREDFADEIYNIYKQAAREIMEKDEKTYKELAESKKITREQYLGLKLRKITVGLGNNDIATAIDKSAKKDEESVTEPLSFESPVTLDRSLYTSDSAEQYILENTGEKTDYDGDTLALYNDTYVEYDDSNFDKIALLTLNKLELTTNNCIDSSYCAETSEGNFVTEIAENCYLNSSKTRIILHPNFAIIYEVNEDIIRIGEIFFNTKIENKYQNMDIEDVVAMQIRLALEQISKGKTIDTSYLNEKQKAMYEKAMNITEENFDKERGIGHGR